MFAEANDLEWNPENADDVVPPEECFTNENNHGRFFIELFETRGKPSVQQAHKWINHALAKYHRPPVNNVCGVTAESDDSAK